MHLPTVRSPGPYRARVLDNRTTIFVKITVKNYFDYLSKILIDLQGLQHIQVKVKFGPTCLDLITIDSRYLYVPNRPTANDRTRYKSCKKLKLNLRVHEEYEKKKTN